MRKKTLSLDARLANAEADLSAGLSLFETAAVRLDEAQAAHAELAAEANAEADRLRILAERAQNKADNSARAAAKVRELIA